MAETKLHVQKSSIQSDSSGIKTTKRADIFISYATADIIENGSWYFSAVRARSYAKRASKTHLVRAEVQVAEDESEALKKFKQQQLRAISSKAMSTSFIEKINDTAKKYFPAELYS